MRVRIVWRMRRRRQEIIESSVAEGATKYEIRASVGNDVRWCEGQVKKTTLLLAFAM